MKKIAFVAIVIAVLVGIGFGAMSLVSAAPTGGRYMYKYTTGPFLLPENSGSLDWALLNNSSTQQQARVTVFKCGLGTVKTPEVPGALVVNIGPGETTHNANTYEEGFYYEIQVECSSRLVFPYASVWPANMGAVIPGTGIGSVSFIRQMP